MRIVLMNYRGDKIKSRKSEYKGQKFDSVLELQIYKEIEKTNPVFINRQFPLLIKPKTPEFKEINWKIDYSVVYPNNIPIHIEAKGVANSSLYLNLKLLNFQSFGDWKRLIIVCSDLMPEKQFNRLKGVHKNSCKAKDFHPFIRNYLNSVQS
jgi:hypothetical protein